MTGKAPPPLEVGEVEYVLAVIGTPNLYLRPYGNLTGGWSVGALQEAKCMKSMEDAVIVKNHVKRCVISTGGFNSFTVCRVIKTVYASEE